jgi:exopolysaccharide biosynthesis predicted pyruvyltransferase EpsI
MTFLWFWFATLPQIKIWYLEDTQNKKKVFFQQWQNEQPVVKLISQVKEQKRVSLLQKIVSKDDGCDFPS